MKVIGITGGIGTGKTTAAGFFESWGAAVIDADGIGHLVMEEDSTARAAIVSRFGAGIVDQEGRIDRRALSDIVFSDPSRLRLLEEIMRPRIHARVSSLVDEYRKEGREVVIIDAPLLIEAGWQGMMDEIWVTTASRQTVLDRLMKKGLTLRQALLRIGCQAGDNVRSRFASHLINTDTDLNSLKDRLWAMWQTMLKQD
jgi:dephospho-CoA kinase